MKSFTGWLAWRGILAVIIGIVALAWPGITVGAFVLLFAVYVFVGAGIEVVRAFSARTAGPVFGHLLLALINVAAGIVAVAWPGITALVLVLTVAFWAFVAGAFEVVMAFGRGETAGQRALFAVTGLVSVALGAVFVVRPDIGAVTIAQIYGLFSIVWGVSTLVTAASIRRVSHGLTPAAHGHG